MLYPVYVHIGDESHAHGVTIPDFPSCLSVADDWDALPNRLWKVTDEQVRNNVVFESAKAFREQLALFFSVTIPKHNAPSAQDT